MPYFIKDIRDCVPDEYPIYFFDANVWLAALRIHGYDRAGKSGELVGRVADPHVAFMEGVIALHNHEPKIKKKLRNVPRIAVTNMLVSEIINAYMRNVAMAIYAAGKDMNLDYKGVYRPTEHHRDELKALISDIRAYEDYIVYLDDDCSGIKPFDVLGSMPANSDYNDQYFYSLMKGRNIPIVTNDRDFNYSDIPILTANGDLLRLHK